MVVQQDFEKSAEWYAKCLEKCYKKAASPLGRYYEYGNGVKQDYDKAIELYLLVEKFDADALYGLARCYEAKEEYKKATEYYKKFIEHKIKN